MKNCINCINMRVKVPVKKAVLIYPESTAYCSKGRIKAVYAYGKMKGKPSEWGIAQHCDEYDEGE